MNGEYGEAMIQTIRKIRLLHNLLKVRFKRCIITAITKKLIFMPTT